MSKAKPGVFSFNAGKKKQYFFKVVSFIGAGIKGRGKPEFFMLKIEGEQYDWHIGFAGNMIKAGTQAVNFFTGAFGGKGNCEPFVAVEHGWHLVNKVVAAKPVNRHTANLAQ